MKRGLHPLGTAASKSNKTPGKDLMLGLQPATLKPQGAPQEHGWCVFQDPRWGSTHRRKALWLQNHNVIPPPQLTPQKAPGSSPIPFPIGATQSDCQGSRPRALSICIYLHRQQGRLSSGLFLAKVTVQGWVISLSCEGHPRTPTRPGEMAV